MGAGEELKLYIFLNQTRRVQLQDFETAASAEKQPGQHLSLVGGDDSDLVGATEVGVAGSQLHVEAEHHAGLSHVHNGCSPLLYGLPSLHMKQRQWAKTLPQTYNLVGSVDSDHNIL